jgi:hypothetical protein
VVAAAAVRVLLHRRWLADGGVWGPIRLLRV